jgi:outer membrane protein OmpA-like peptidoglycan-associated protein
MATYPRLLILALLCAAPLVSGCMTRRVEPQISQAVLEARARANVPPTGCAALGVSAAAPVSVRFPFKEAELQAPAVRALDQAAAWLACNPTASAAISGAGDAVGTPEQRQDLAARRVEAALAHLAQRGVSADRVRRLTPTTGAPPAGVLIIQAEGRGW